MQVVSFCSQEGGSGKTTLACHLAVQAERQGSGPVALLDADPQGSLASWWRSRAGSRPVYAATSPATIGADLPRMRRQGFRYLLIDTPPAACLSIQRVIEHSDLVVVPARPSHLDLSTVRTALDLAEGAGKKPSLLVLNGAVPRARATGDAMLALAQHGNLAPVVLHRWNALASPTADGRTVTETDPVHPAAREIARLWACLEHHLARLGSRRASQHRRPSGGRPRGRTERLPASVPAAVA